MQNIFEIIFSNSFYFLALINPASKVFLLSSLQPPPSRQQIWSISLNASLTGLGILLILSAIGKFLFTMIFHVELYSIQIVGGIVLFTVGFQAIRKGVFFSRHLSSTDSDISIVPLAAPLIAGPGTITAVISFATHHGVWLTWLAITLAVAGNFGIMTLSQTISRFMDRYHAAGPLIRIAGLIVAAVAVQMFLTGLGQWFTLTLDGRSLQITK